MVTLKSENTDLAMINQKPVLLVGGKGGVGKTTCAAAIAAHMAAAGRKTLLITSDMTPSLSDVLERQIGNNVTPVSEETIVSWWRSRFGRDFSDILEHIVDLESLDKESQHQLLDYIGSAPSLREETMLDVIRDMSENRGYNQIVWDTAPAGETLNLLNMPTNIRKHLRAGVRVFEGLDRIGKQLIGRRSIAGIMDEWCRASEDISGFLHVSSAFLIVANPEALVVNQARRLMATLLDYKLTIHGLIINRVIADPDSPTLAAMQGRQGAYIEELKRLAGERPVATLPFSLTEIRGLKRLQEIGEMIRTDLFV